MRTAKTPRFSVARLFSPYFTKAILSILYCVALFPSGVRAETSAFEADQVQESEVSAFESFDEVDRAFASLALAFAAGNHPEVRRLETWIAKTIHLQPATFLRALEKNWEQVGQQRLSFLLGASGDDEGLRISEKSLLLEARWQAIQFVVSDELLDVRQICLEELSGQLRNLDGFWDESEETVGELFPDEPQSQRAIDRL